MATATTDTAPVPMSDAADDNAPSSSAAAASSNSLIDMEDCMGSEESGPSVAMRKRKEAAQAPSAGTAQISFDLACQQQPAKRAYTRTAPTPSELKARAEDLEQKLVEAGGELHRARCEIDEARDQIAELQQKATDSAALLLKKQEQLDELKAEAKKAKTKAKELGKLKSEAEVKAKKMHQKMHRLSGFHPKDVQARMFEDLDDQYAGKLSKKAIEKRMEVRDKMEGQIKAKAEALERDAQELANLRVTLAHLEGPQADKDRRALEEHERREETRRRRLDVQARAARELENLRREDARALLQNDDAAAENDGSDDQRSDGDSDYNDDSAASDDDGSAAASDDEEKQDA